MSKRTMVGLGLVAPMAVFLCAALAHALRGFRLGDYVVLVGVILGLGAISVGAMVGGHMLLIPPERKSKFTPPKGRRDKPCGTIGKQEKE